MAATAQRLVERLEKASEAFIELVESIQPDQWARQPKAGTWSPSKDAEHVADGIALHLWFVRAALGERRGRQPVINRARMAAQLSQPDVVALLRERTRESGETISRLSDAQLERPCRTRTVGTFVERVIIGHIQ